MADRLVVDLTDHDQVVVNAWPAGELAPSPVGEPHPAQRPLDAEALEDLRWYVEDYLRVPYGVYEQRGPQVAARIRDWGQRVFAALFGWEPARLAYAALRPGGDTELLVRSSSPSWLGLPWELAWDPRRPAPLAVELGSVTRMLPAAGLPQARVPSGARLRVLLVIARPAGQQDVGYRMIARPLLQRLEAVRGEVHLEVLRPPTFQTFQRTVQEAAAAGSRTRSCTSMGMGCLLVGHGVAALASAATTSSSGSRRRGWCCLRAQVAVKTRSRRRRSPRWSATARCRWWC